MQMVSRTPTFRVQVRNWNIERALTPGSAPFRIEDIATAVGASRTPAKEALDDLEHVGLVGRLRYKGFRYTFGGPDDIRCRARVLGAAAAAGYVDIGDGPIGERLNQAVGACWAGIAWDVLEAWPRHAAEWGVDLRQQAKELAEADERIVAATNGAELGAAIAALSKVF